MREGIGIVWDFLSLLRHDLANDLILILNCFAVIQPAIVVEIRNPLIHQLVRNLHRLIVGSFPIRIHDFRLAILVIRRHAAFAGGDHGRCDGQQKHDNPDDRLDQLAAVQRIVKRLYKRLTAFARAFSVLHQSLPPVIFAAAASRVISYGLFPPVVSMAVAALRVMSCYALRALLYTLRGGFCLSAEVPQKAARHLLGFHIILTPLVMLTLLMRADRRRPADHHAVRVFEFPHLAIRVFPLIFKIQGAQTFHTLVISLINLRSRRPRAHAQNSVIILSIHNPLPLLCP